jgi:hypothetical protein
MRKPLPFIPEDYARREDVAALWSEVERLKARGDPADVRELRLEIDQLQGRCRDLERTVWVLEHGTLESLPEWRRRELLTRFEEDRKERRRR